MLWVLSLSHFPYRLLPCRETAALLISLGIKAVSRGASEQFVSHPHVMNTETVTGDNMEHHKFI